MQYSDAGSQESVMTQFKGCYAKLAHPGYSAIVLILVTVASLRADCSVLPRKMVAITA